MIVYVGIGRASLLINIVRFDLRPAMRKKDRTGEDTATRDGKVHLDGFCAERCTTAGRAVSSALSQFLEVIRLLLEFEIK